MPQFPRYSAPALLVLGLLCVAAPSHAEVHKCVVGGKTVYQDEPCPGAVQPTGASLTSRIRAPSPIPPPPRPEQPHKRGLRDIYSDMLASAAEERSISDEMRRTMDRLRMTARTPSQDVAANALIHEIAARSQQAHAHSEALHDELSRLCPHGASLSAKRLDCF